MNDTDPTRRVKQSLVAVMICVLLVLIWWLVPHPLVILVLGFAPLVVFGVFQRPFWVCLAFIVFSFFRIHEAFPVLYPLHIPQLLAIGSVAVVSWNLFITRKISIIWTKELTVFSLFFILVSVGVPLASSKPLAMSAYTGTYVKIGLMVLVIAWLMRTTDEFILAARSFVLAGVLIGSVALLNKSAGIGLVEGTRVTIGRDIGSMLGDPNDLSLVLTFPASFALSLFLNAQRPKLDRFLGLAGFFLIAAAVIATQSRGGLLGMLAVVGIFSARRVKSKALLFGGGGLVVLVLYAAAGISNRASGGAAESGIDESAMGRIYAWGAAWRMALTHPLFGVGINNFVANYYAYSSHWDGLNHAVHSTWFGVLAETGFVGFFVFVTLLLRIVWSSWKTLQFLESTHNKTALYTAAEAVLAGIIGFAISGTFLTQGFLWPLYILLSINAALQRHVNIEALSPASAPGKMQTASSQFAKPVSAAPLRLRISK